MAKSHSGKILIIDDTQENIALLVEILQKKGYHISAASSGERGIVIAEKIKPDLILLDIMMPGIDGYETCRRLKSQKKTKKIPIIFVSAKHETDDILTGFSVGGVDYINKPFFEEEVCARIKSQIKIQQLNRKLKKSRNKAIKANNAKSIFLANMSHELRTPMHGILSLSSLGIKKHKNLSIDDSLKYFTYIKSSADRLLGLINNLLDLAKLESGKMELSIHQDSLLQISRTCIDEQQARLDELEIKINFSEDNVSNSMNLDPIRIGQVITNFLSNAIKFSAKGDTLDISITNAEIRTNQDAYFFSIRDRGLIIPEDELKTVFKKFSQSSVKINNIEGTGLGLTISKEIIDAHHGKIWLENHPDGGVLSCFIIPNQQNE